MQKILPLLFCCTLFLVACDKHDPILPGNRTAIFASSDIKVLNENITNLPDTIAEPTYQDCPYTQDSDNVIRDGNRRIFAGFPTPNSVASNQTPVCDGNYVYAGLTTGELVKINPKSRNVLWIADIYSASNMTGGASVVDITAPIILDDNWVYVGGLGNAFCKINAKTGGKKWCTEISVGLPFIVSDAVSFVISSDNNLYAIRNSDGAAYWRTGVKKQVSPIYSNGVITVGKQKFNASNGEAIK